MYRFLDMAGDPRQAQFDYFRTMTSPYVSVTVPCDITPLHTAVKTRGLPFFLTLLHTAINAANDVPELRRRINLLRRDTVPIAAVAELHLSHAADPESGGQQRAHHLRKILRAGRKNSPAAESNGTPRPCRRAASCPFLRGIRPPHGRIQIISEARRQASGFLFNGNGRCGVFSRADRYFQSFNAAAFFTKYSTPE